MMPIVNGCTAWYSCTPPALIRMVFNSQARRTGKKALRAGPPAATTKPMGDRGHQLKKYRATVIPMTIAMPAIRKNTSEPEIVVLFFIQLMIRS